MNISRLLLFNLDETVVVGWREVMTVVVLVSGGAKNGPTNTITTSKLIVMKNDKVWTPNLLGFRISGISFWI